MGTTVKMRAKWKKKRMRRLQKKRRKIEQDLSKPTSYVAPSRHLIEFTDVYNFYDVFASAMVDSMITTWFFHDVQKMHFYDFEADKHQNELFRIIFLHLSYEAPTGS